MKKNILFLIFLLCLIIKIDSVYADTWRCAYKGNGDRFKLTYEFDNENNKMEVVNKEKGDHSNIYKYTSQVAEGEINSLEKNECPIIHLVYAYESDSSGYDPDTGGGHTMWYYYHSFADSWLREQRKECVNGKDNTFDSECIKKAIEDFFSISYTSINYYSLTLDRDNEINKDKTQVNTCFAYDKLKIDLENKYKDYSISKEASLIINAKNVIEKITSTCRSMLSYRDFSIYDGSGQLVPDGCVEKCLKFGEEIEQLKKQYNISSSTDNSGECGFSGRLIQFIANIIKWVKYIIPVIVIVLGILDFIQAISAEKEEEMKKAQGRFVRRLIVAALIFIIPFIIEFVLNKMGFTANGCGIIDL